MGLTIHYRLQAACREAGEVRKLTARLRRDALRLPFERVGPLLEVIGSADELERQATSAVERWLLTQVAAAAADDDAQAPLHVIAFAALPGRGCEPANLGFVRRAETVTQTPAPAPPRDDERRASWSWTGFCKTGGACRPEHGGGANFLRRHLLVLKLLARACRLDVDVDVFDEAGLWQPRDVRQFIAAAGRWNRAVGAELGRLGEFTLEQAWREIARPADAPTAALDDQLDEQLAKRLAG